MSLLAAWADALWNPWLLGLFLCAGLLLSLGCRCFPILHPRVWLSATIGSPRQSRPGSGISSLQALSTALASTIGTGSIAGVATAIYLGGPGSIFWMWVSALLGMSIGYVEKYLSVRYQHTTPEGGRQGGPMFYLRDGLHAPLLARWFALACLPAALAGGDLVQSASISAALHTAFGLDRLAVGVVTALLAGLIMAGGLHRIARVSERLIPLMALLYLGGGCVVLWARAEHLPEALGLILSSALSPRAALAGGGGYTVLSALRYGVSRGVFTNEAGLGTSAMAHGAAQVDHPARQGMWGIFEVAFSTLLVCTMTALVILVSGVYSPQQALSQIQAGAIPPSALGAPLTARAFASVLGSSGYGLVAVSLLLFAFSSILGWSYYGQQGLRFLSRSDRFLPLFHGLFLLFIVLGAVADTQAVWQLVDLCNALLAIPNLVALLALSPQAFASLKMWRVRF